MKTKLKSGSSFEIVDSNETSILSVSEAGSVTIAGTAVATQGEVPTKTSDLTNDSGFITGVSWEQVTGKPTFATVAKTGSYNDLKDTPQNLITGPQVEALLNNKADKDHNHDAFYAPTTHGHILATAGNNGFMSATDKANLDTIVESFNSDDADTTIDTIKEVLKAFENAPEGTNIVNALAGKVDKVSGKGLSTNDLTAALKTNYDAAYTHSTSTHARTDATKVEASSTNGKIKINGTETTVYTHPGSGTNPHGTTKSDVGLGNVGNFKAVSTVASQGLTDTEKANARANIGAGTSSFSGSYNDLTNKPTIPTNTNQTIKSGTTTFGANDAVEITAGTNVTVTPDATNKKITISSTNTTYNAATQSAAGLMSAADKTKLDGVATGATKVTTDTVSGWGYTKNAGTVTSVKVGSTPYSPSSGVVSLPAYPTVPTSLKNPNAITIKAGSDTVSSYDGSAAKTFTVAASSTAGAFTISDGTTTKTIQLAGKFTDNNTTYTFATGDSNGQIKVTPSGGTAQNISVKGLGSAAYTASTAYAAASHTHDDRYYTESEIDTKLAGKANSSHTHDYLGKTTYEWNKEFAAGSNGAISLGRYNMYDTQLTFDIDSTTTTAMSGKLVIATQNGRICEAKVFGDATNTLVPCLQIYQSAISNNRSWIEIFCSFAGWSKNKVHIYGVALNSATVEKQMTSVTITDGVVSSSNITSGDTKWTGTIVNAITSTVAPISHGTHVTAATVKSALGTGTGTSKYLREDGTWVTPPNTQNANYGNITTSGTITSTAVTSATGVLVYDSSNKIQRATAANARAIIGAGTSNLTIGTTSTTAAAGNHTHTASLAADTGTSAITLSHGSKYKLTAGGSSVIFTMPSDNNTWRPLGTGAEDACAGNDSRLSDSRTPKSHTHGSITNDGKLGTASRVVVTDGSKNITVSSSITTTELGYLDGVTSNIQTQLNAKQDKVTFTYNSTTKELTIE